MQGSHPARQFIFICRLRAVFIGIFMSSFAPIWSTACPDWEKKILAKESLIACEPLFPGEAEMALRVFKELIVVDVAGKPTIGEITAQWVLILLEPSLVHMIIKVING